MTIPPDLIETDFVASLRETYIHNHPVARPLACAASVLNELGRHLLATALSRDPEAFRKILVDKFHYRLDEIAYDDEDDAEAAKCAPDHRPPAALLFLYGVNRDYWTATAQEKEFARALIITTYGKEAFDMLAPEKTKDDLAKEAGVPSKSFIHKTPGDGRTPKQIVDDYLYVQQLLAEANYLAARKPIDLDAMGVALGDYLAALKRYFPEAYEAQAAQLRKQLAPAIASAYVDIAKERFVK